jgi:uncharacterized protein (TIGR02284 family)
MKEKREIISVLHALIETLKDGQLGFRRAAEGVGDAKLKSLFRDYSDQRSRFATALQTEARRFGDKQKDNGNSAVGALHRGWMNLKSAVTGGDEHAILTECERGEDSAVEEFQKAAEDDLPPALQEIVLHQRSEIKATHDRIRDLRDAVRLS